MREAVFNALGSLDAVEDAHVLDGFAGSGALGIEALSRGAETCTFVERDRSARVVLEANLATTGLEPLARVISGDLLGHLAQTGERFDLVLLDPPHATDQWPAILEAVTAVLAADAVVVLESDRAVVPDGDDGPWRVIREKGYGGTVVQMVRARSLPGAP